MKTIALLAILFVSYSSWGKVSFKWLGISGFVLDDGVTTLVFDPAMTRAPLYDYLPFRAVQSDEAEVFYWMNRCGIKSVQATFVNHAHFDHVIDAPMVVKKFGGVLYGSSSVINVGLGQGLAAKQVQKIKDNDGWKIGNFTVRIFDTPHAPHIMDIMLMDGNIEKPLKSPTSIWNYRVGDTFSFLITHPSGRIIFQSTGRVMDEDKLKSVTADVLLLTIANRHTSENLIQQRIIPSKARKLIPLHHDNFFYKMNRDKEIDYLWGVKVNEFNKALENAKSLKPIWPKYCEEVHIL